MPLVDGEHVRNANLDVAASAPALCAVRAAVDEFLPWYSSVHRGTGFASMVATEAYEASRGAVRSFLRARVDDAVVVTRNTTDAMNLMASALPEDAEVVVFAGEHHANLLPWRRRRVTVLPVPGRPDAAVEQLGDALRATVRRGCTLVAITGASNVTGEVWPVRELTRVAHRHGARLLLDAAQLAPHAPIDMVAWDVDYLAMSGHKLYAPYGAGVLVGRPDWLEGGEPFLAGGGAVQFVTTTEVMWTGLPDRQEAGSPNVIGAVALAAACRTLEQAGMARLASEEQRLLGRLLAGLGEVPGVELYRIWSTPVPRIGVVPFTVAGIPPGLLAAVLSAEYGIGVRHGCFCAHPLMLHLLRVDASIVDGILTALRGGHRPSMPGAVRASLGVMTPEEHVDRLIDAVSTIARTGPRWTYRRIPGSGDYEPAPDLRRFPPLRALHGSGHGVHAVTGESAGVDALARL